MVIISAWLQLIGKMDTHAVYTVPSQSVISQSVISVIRISFIRSFNKVFFSCICKLCRLKRRTSELTEKFRFVVLPYLLKQILFQYTDFQAVFFFSSFAFTNQSISLSPYGSTSIAVFCNVRKI